LFGKEGIKVYRKALSRESILKYRNGFVLLKYFRKPRIVLTRIRLITLLKKLIRWKNVIWNEILE